MATIAASTLSSQNLWLRQILTALYSQFPLMRIQLRHAEVLNDLQSLLGESALLSPQRVCLRLLSLHWSGKKEAT